MNRYLLELPWPHTVNHYWLATARRVKRGPKAGKAYMGKMLSPEALAFRGETARAVRAGHRTPPRLSGRLEILVFACPKDHARRRDLDNLWKCLLDALTHAEVILDDVQFDDERMIRGNPVPGGRIWLSICPFDPDSAFEAVRQAGIDAMPQDLLAAAA